MFERIATRSGNLHHILGEHSAGWLDPKYATLIVDKVREHDSLGSSCPAKKRWNRDLVATLQFRILRLEISGPFHLAQTLPGLRLASTAGRLTNLSSGPAFTSGKGLNRA